MREISLFVRRLIIVTVVVSIVDIVAFYAIANGQATPTIPFVILIIVATMIPIAVNFWVWLVYTA
jgi:hypothetical protein